VYRALNVQTDIPPSQGSQRFRGAVPLVWTWDTWPDVLIDFGRELYIAWQLAAGKTLYTDIPYFHGPLSPYVNSVWFRMLGTSLRTLEVCNLLILTGLVVLLYRVLRGVGSQLAATSACCTFLAVFAFGQLVSIGNYNFVCPYSQELTHGMFLSFAAVYCFNVYQRRHVLAAAAGSGFALGLGFLTKPEVFLAAFPALLAGFGLTIAIDQPARREAARVAGTFAAAMLVPAVVSFGLFARTMPAVPALEATLGGWPWVLHSQAPNLVFYRLGMGTLDTAASGRSILRWTLIYAVLLGPPAAIGLLAGRPALRRMRLLLLLLYVVLLGALAARAQPLQLSDVARPLPVAMILLGVGVSLALARRRHEPGEGARLVRMLVLIIVGLGFLAKILLNARVYHYGFALAMPATLVVIVALVDWVPGLIDRWGGRGASLRLFSLAFLTVAVMLHLSVMHHWLAQKTHVVGSGADAFLADERGPVVNQALAEIDRRFPPGATLSVFPDGPMLNFLSRRIDPVPHLNMTPLTLAIFGEDNIVASFEAHSPDVVALVHLDTSEYGTRFFGHDYAQRLYAWVRRNYREIAVFGARPLRDERFGIALLERIHGPDSPR
jgi:hypothetical protein